MFCNECGTELRDDARFCTGCGAAVKQKAPEQTEPVWQPEPAPVETSYTAPQQEAPYQSYMEPRQETPYQSYTAPRQEGQTAHHGSVSFGEAIKLFFDNYANFEGRASKSEYWWAWLFTFLISFIPVVSWIAMIACLVPGLAISVRRLHDTGKPWTYIFMGLIPLAGPIILLVQYCQDSVGDNEWGPGPNRW